MKLRLLAFGDSLTAGYHHMGHAFAPWAPLLQSLLGSDVVCDHIGLSGFTTQQMLDTADEQNVTDVVPMSWPGYRTQLRRHRYDVVLILGGTNDLADYGHGPMPTQRTVSNLATLHAYAHEAGARSVAMTIPESKGAVYFETRSPPFRVRLDANEAIRAWAAKQPAHQVHFVDASALVPYSGTNGLWEPDGLHLSQRGYEAFGRALAPQIADFVRATRGAPNMAPTPAGSSAASAADADAEPGWYPGARVSIFGLTKAAQHNGKYGRLSARAPPSGGGEGRRLGVELEEGGAVLSVRCENLVLAPVEGTFGGHKGDKGEKDICGGS
jgi:lysophospholipase L1-like esterase